ncbi:MAG TPA: hypothetical protein VI489_00030, partial [Candidatus Brocadiaceae bacterium]
MVVPGACYVGRSLARRDRKRKGKIPKIKYGIPRISRAAFSPWIQCPVQVGLVRPSGRGLF